MFVCINIKCYPIAFFVVCLFVCLFVCLSVCLFVCLFVYCTPLPSGALLINNLGSSKSLKQASLIVSCEMRYCGSTGLCLFCCSTLVCCQPTELILGFYFVLNYPILPPPPQTRRAFQSLPPHLRRRAAAHNIHMLPRRMRPRAANEVCLGWNTALGFVLIMLCHNEIICPFEWK